MIYTKDSNELKREIKILLINKNLTQLELAKKLDKSPQSFNNFLRSQNMSLNTLADIANAADCDLEINFIPR